jgi:hypothetical protein
MSQGQSVHRVLWLGDCLRAGNPLAEGQWPPVHLAIPCWASAAMYVASWSVRLSTLRPPAITDAATWLCVHLAVVSIAASFHVTPALARAHTAVQLLATCDACWPCAPLCILLVRSA